jgi:hypothetical protein
MAQLNDHVNELACIRFDCVRVIVTSVLRVIVASVLRVHLLGDFRSVISSITFMKEDVISGLLSAVSEYPKTMTPNLFLGKYAD